MSDTTSLFFQQCRIGMERLWIPVLFSLLLTACGQKTTTGTADQHGSSSAFEGSVSSSSDAYSSLGNSSSIVQLFDTVYWNTSVSEKTFTDDRDGHSYRTVRIGFQVWMAENLNYDSGEGSFCYDDHPIHCQNYGRLYTWNAVMLDSPRVCPDGWRLPSDKAWETLSGNIAYENIDALKPYYDYTVMLDAPWDVLDRWPGIGLMLKAGFIWEDAAICTDDYGFSAIPAGYYFDKQFMGQGRSTYFWSSSQFPSYVYDKAYAWNLDGSMDRLGRSLQDTSHAFSVRCLQNN